MSDYRFELLPCPFCGGKGKLSRNTMKISGKSEMCAWVYCKKCGCKTRYSVRSEKNESYISEAVLRWNKRPEAE